MVEIITADQLASLQEADEPYTLVDTRPEASYEAWHVAGAENYPFSTDDELDADALRAFESAVDGSGAVVEPVVTVCAKGVSSRALADELAHTDAYGDADVRTVDDGMEGWSRVYDVAEVATGRDDLELLQVQRRAKGCLGYVVGSPARGEAAVVDPTRHTDEFVTAARERGYEITHVFDTHVHADHVSGGRKLADEVGVPYHLSERAAERGVEYEYDALGRNEVVHVGDVEVKALRTPGHTTEMASYLVADEAVLTGDTLFVDGVGRTELEFGEQSAARGAELLFESIRGRLMALPDDVTVLPSHVTVTEEGEFASGVPGEPVTAHVGTLRTSLDLLGLDEAAFVDDVASNVPEKPPNYETVIDVNRGVDDRPAPQEATELELGPNNCSAG
ncbi:MAG: MBL fold metallo-hydrolase [Haloarculaceae archaeon]